MHDGCAGAAIMIVIGRWKDRRSCHVLAINERHHCASPGIVSDFVAIFTVAPKLWVVPDFDIALQHKASHIAAALRTDLNTRAFP
jgi:hypothetical protein